jgi:hypothetical protein
MNNISKEDALLELEKVREQLLCVVNTKIDVLINKILNDSDEVGDEQSNESIYPLSTMPFIFKGTKPTAVFFSQEKVEVKTWISVYSEILRRCVADSDMLAKFMSLRNKISGRTRVILSDNSEGMNKPVQMADGLFAEAFFDTEWLIRILTNELLDIVQYDYSGISVSIINKKKKRTAI